MNIEIRKAIKDDVEVFTEIYNEAVLKGTCCCDKKTYTPEERIGWFREHEEDKYPLYACLLNGKVIGYSYLSGYRPGREAVEHVAEVSYYLDSSVCRQGIGTVLLEYMIDVAKENKFTVLIAILLGCNKGSIALLEKHGFKQWGAMKDIVDTGNGFVDHLYYGKNI